MTDSLITRSETLRQRADQILQDLNLLDIWQSIGATVNSVGSYRNDLMLGNRDIDLHIYTDPFVLADSFRAIAQLAERPGIRSISYTNLIEAEDRCIEWHAHFDASDGETWKLDMIHILPDSRYVGYFEKVAERIMNVLTPETREAILLLKDSLPADQNVPGIVIYRAVIEGGVRDLDSFTDWQSSNSTGGIDTWIP